MGKGVRVPGLGSSEAKEMIKITGDDSYEFQHYYLGFFTHSSPRSFQFIISTHAKSLLSFVGPTQHTILAS